MKPWKAILAALVIFLAGVGSGGMAARLYLARGQPVSPPRTVGAPPLPWIAARFNFLHRMGANVGLTPEQQQQIDTILRDSRNRIQALWAPVAPQFGEEMRRVNEGIKAVLTPEQRIKYEQLLKDRRSRWHPGQGPRRPSPTNSASATSPPPTEAPRR